MIKGTEKMWRYPTSNNSTAKGINHYGTVKTPYGSIHY